MSDKLRILIVEDVPTDAELEFRELQRSGINCFMERVQTEDEFVRTLEKFEPDVILSDFSLPSFDGLSALTLAQQLRPDTPFIFVSGTIGEERAIESLKRGATDYVLKTNLQRLAPAVRRALQDVAQRNARRQAELQLRQSEERFQMAARATNDAIWDWDLITGQIWWNESAHKLFGYAPEAIGKHANWRMERIHPDDRSQILAEINAVIEGDRNFWSGQYRFSRAHGDYAYVFDRGHIVRDARGHAYRMIGAMMDITERKSQEVKIMRLSRIHEMLSGINAIIVRVRDREELFREACRIAVEHGKFKLAWIGLVDRQKSTMEPRVWMGEASEFLSKIHLSLEEIPGQVTGISRIAMRTGKPVVVNDVASDKRVGHAPQALEHGFRSFIVLPLIVESEPIGQFSMYTTEAEFFDQDEVKLLEELAGDISFALDHIGKSERLDYLAYYDGLTGLPNRSLFNDRVARLITAAGDGHNVVIMVFDLERFRTINETLGIAMGDMVLKQMAERLAAAIAEPGTVARISADCFAVALTDVRNEADIAHALEYRILPALDEPLTVADEQLRIPAKAGIAVYPDDGKDAATLFVNASSALMKAKRSGERFLFYAPQMNARVAEKLRLENQLRIAVLRQQFVLYYEPRIDLATGDICALEALIRWQSPERGVVAPGEFIPLLEETGMILKVGQWAIQEAAAQHAAWRARGLRAPRIAVNVSPLQLRQQNFVQDVKAAIAAGGAGSDCIDIELTETMLMEDIEGNIRKLAALREIGVEVALDDFGTGYSSLSYIARLPVNSLKIDRSFVTRMTEGPEAMAIISTVISLARSLYLKVVAEGVEFEEQRTLLRLLKCDEIQGHLASRPLPAHEVERLFAKEP